MASPAGYGALLECPYNKSHRVQATAMARHLYKCRKMYPDTQFVTCPFNHAHKIAEPELKMHTATCEDRANFDMYKYCITTAAATHTSETQEPELIYNNDDPIAPKKVQDDDECWDDLRIPAYNPQEYCATAKIIRKATLKTPAEKRAFYEQEIQRHKELETKIKQESEAGSSSRSRSRSRSGSRFRRARAKRSRSRSRHRSPLPIRSRRSRSNSRKSRSLSPARDRKRRRSRSIEERVVRRRSPSPLAAVRRERAALDRYERERADRERYARAYDRYEYQYASRYDSYSRYPPPERYAPRYDYHERYPVAGSSYERERRISRRDSRDREDEEHIYRRDFRD
ncbi:arginine/serine-rich protein PNISR-like [Topomyia yanbarensis]|uniref:arginine/serine-rich protein PNISR-like n=1 Tax=Topomyia yanbarensis TaxID=2498891 RepID=UPI00273CE3C8|nr:arginine/serine-rich protein PNISR-like [Topomyia yanbarensis]